jgi:hypothetical protein
MKIKVMSYEKCREDFFVNLMKHAENKIKYWKRQKGYRCEIEDNLSEAGAEMQYCQDALFALEKQMPKKAKGDYHSCPHYRCPNCNSSVKMYDDDNTYPYCAYCGQALDWSDTE